MTPRAPSFFCDTSVLVAAADVMHEHHARSVGIVSHAIPARAYCTAHAIAEMYSTLTSSRYLRVLSLEQVLEVVKRVQATFTVVDLAPVDYLALVEMAVRRGTRGGQIYDALHLHAAARCDAKVIYTWNEKHFRMLAPSEMVERIRTP